MLNEENNRQTEVIDNIFFEPISPFCELKIGVVGLGYVGLPLAVELGKRFPSTRGYDISVDRVNDLRNLEDKTREISSEDLRKVKNLTFHSDLESLRDCNFFIITVPTPVTKDTNQPDLTPLVSASGSIGSILKKGDIVVYESTVFPGATEDVCVPVLEEASGLKFNVDFYVGYSPERINPGDKVNTISTIKKVTSGSTPEIAELVDSVYRSIISAGTFKAKSIKVAEAAKVIENTQRDVNIALINEFSMIFDRIGINTHDVIEAARTKWNFVPLQPGLVGGHCIGVDPYYLSFKAQSLGVYPEIILASRRTNNRVGAFVTQKVIRLMIKKRIPVADSKVLVLGFTFKENCPDARNTKVVDLVNEFSAMETKVAIYDPWIEHSQMNGLGKFFIEKPEYEEYDVIVLAVPHKQFIDAGFRELRRYGKENSVFFDLKSAFTNEYIDGQL